MGQGSFGAEVFYGVGCQGAECEGPDNDEGDQEDQRLGQDEGANADGYPISEIVEPAMDQPPAQGQGDKGGDEGEADKIGRNQG